MADWLVKRLTPRKQKEARWTSLAACFEKLCEEFFDPEFSRLEALRSYFSAHTDDLSRKLREMGDYFAADLPEVTDRPIAVAWRKLELEYKDLELILQSVFRRHYGDLRVAWLPLFAPLDEPYGTRFISAAEYDTADKNTPPPGAFLTSRGMLSTDFGHLLALGFDKLSFTERIIPLLKRTKPLHIVFEGHLWYINFDLPFTCLTACSWERTGMVSLEFHLRWDRFDYTPADVRPLDTQSITLTRERIQYLSFDLTESESRDHLDHFAHFDDCPADAFPLDMPVGGRYV